jgi:peptide/nickel transport system substrate-binding protein
MSTLRMAIKGKPENNINPLFYNAFEDLWIIGCVYQGIVAFDEHLKAICRLAESITHTSNHNEWTIELKDELFWHDGTKITTRDIKFTVEALLHPSLNLNKGRFSSPISGIDDYLNGNNNEISGIKLINDKEIKFFMTSSDKSFLHRLLLPPIPHHKYGSVDIDHLYDFSRETLPIGCGPYQLMKIEDNSYFFRRNSYFHLGSPIIEKMEMHFFEQELDIVDKLLNRKVDFAIITPESLNEVKDMHFLSLFKLPQPLINIIGINHRNKILKNKNVRKALMYAIDKARINYEVYCGASEVIHQYYPNLLGNYACGKQIDYEFNKEKVYSLLNNTGFERNSEGIWHKERMELVFNLALPDNDKYLKKIIMNVQESMYSVGIKLNVSFLSSSSFQKQVLENNEFDLWLRGMNIALDPDPSAVFGESSKWSNTLGWDNKRSKDLLLKGKKEKDILKRQEIYKEWSNLVNEELPCLFINSPLILQVVNKCITGLKTDPRGALWNIHELVKEE